MPADMTPILAPARTADDLAMIGTLFSEYAESLRIDLAYQDFHAELAALPGKYAPPAGELLLARGPSDEPLGCAAFRPLARAGACELKRLYVRAAAQGTGLGRTLATDMLRVARARGYQEMLLDTLPDMTAAIALYRSLGFREIAPYWNSTAPGTLYFGKTLDP